MCYLRYNTVQYSIYCTILWWSWKWMVQYAYGVYAILSDLSSYLSPDNPGSAVQPGVGLNRPRDTLRQRWWASFFLGSGRSPISIETMFAYVCVCMHGICTVCSKDLFCGVCILLTMPPSLCLVTSSFLGRSRIFNSIFPIPAFDLERSYSTLDV